jgi:hypothetical protein
VAADGGHGSDHDVCTGAMGAGAILVANATHPSGNSEHVSAIVDIDNGRAASAVPFYLFDANIRKMTKF